MAHTIDTSRLSNLPAETPIFMLNLLKFHSQAQYTSNSPPPCSGQEAYMTRYVPAFNNVVSSIGDAEATPVFLGQWCSDLVAGTPGEEWDLVVIVRYPSLAVFRAITECEKYRLEAEPHRLAALEKWRLVALNGVPMP